MKQVKLIPGILALALILIALPCQAEEAQPLVSLFEEHGSVMLIIDPDTGKIERANKAAVNFYDYPVEKLETMRIQDINLLSPDEVAQEMQLAALENRNYFNFKHRLADGDIRHVEVYSYPVQWEGETKLYSIIHDVTPRLEAEQALYNRTAIFITILGVATLILAIIALLLYLSVRSRNKALSDLKKSEEDLRESKRRLITLIGNLPGMAYRCQPDRDWTMVYVSEGCKAITGYAAEDLINNKVVSYADLIHPNDREYVWQTISSKSDKPLPFKLEYRMIDRSGKVKWVWEQGQHVYAADDTTEAIEGFVTEITELKEVEKKVLALNEELEQRVKERTIQLVAVNEELESFAYSVSHDLRAPLRAMSGFSDLLISMHKNCLDEQGLHYLQRIKKASERMGDLIDDLLTLSKVTRAEFKQQSVDISSISEAILSELQAEEPQRQVNIEIADGLKAQGDTALLQIALENLLRNAWKFTCNCDTAKIELGVSEKNNNPVYFIRDNGVGFNMEYADKLFTPFQRLHRTEEYPGTGIGLATVERVINRHGGKVWAESEVGKGATFYFTLGLGKELEVC